MKGLLTKDFLTVKKKYGIARLIMDLAIIAALMIILEGAGSIYISFLLGSAGSCLYADYPCQF